MLNKHLALSLNLGFVLTLCSLSAIAQNNVGIGTTQPNPNAVLQLVSPDSNQGFLIPSLTTAQRNAMSELTTDDNGLMVFDLEEKAFYYWNDGAWVSMIGNAKAGGDLVGNYPNPQIREAAVTNEKLAENAVNSSRIEDNTIEVEDIRPTRNNSFLITTTGGSVFWETLDILERSDLPLGNIYVGTQNGEAAAISAQGDGFILIGNGTSVTSVKTRGDVTFQGPDGYGDVQLLENVVTSAEIASGAVGTSELQDSSIVNVDISELANISGTKINPNFGSQNITSTGSLTAQTITATGKASSTPTVAADGSTTLTTKGYVDEEILAVTQDLTDGAGIADFTYDGTEAQTIMVNNGNGLDFDNNGALQLADNGVTAAKINGDVAGSGLSKNTTNGALQQDFSTISTEANSVDNEDIFAFYDDSNASMRIIRFANLVNNLSASESLTIPFTRVTGTAVLEQIPDVGPVDVTFGNTGTEERVESIEVDEKGRVVNVVSGVPASDQRLKEDITPLKGALDKVLQIQGYQYHWKNREKDSTLQLGVIAQELEKIYPELVKVRSDQFKGVNYTGLVPVLIEALKEQQQQIQSLKTQLNNSEHAEARMQTLEAENEAIRSELDEIKEVLGIKQASTNHTQKSAGK